MKLSSLCLCGLFLVLAPFHASSGTECWNGCSYQCWNAKSQNVENPSHFLIDIVQEKIVLTAKNSVCHISLDLSAVENVWNVTPSPDTLSACTGDPHYESADKCHNFHHILLLPVAPSNETMIGDSATPLSNTILECGSNAFAPQCNYRMRSNLSSVTMADGSDYVPNDGGYGHTSSLWLSTGRLVSATHLGVGKFGLVMSGVPYSGPIQVGTVSSWFDRSVQFVSMYEVDDYMYIFFREDPDETKREVIYSRVARVCKNDMGVQDINPFPLSYNVFTTFLKARVACVSGGANGDTPYYYDELQDTFLVESESEDGSVERNLYAVFTSPENGPEGSAVCVYSFGGGEEGTPSLGSVFEGKYLTETALNQFDQVDNPNPFTCAEGRSAEEANSLYLMADTAPQTSGSSLHLQLNGYSFRKILVTEVTDLSGVTHDVMFITSSRGGALVLLKTVYDRTRQQPHIISEQEIKLSAEDPQTTPNDLPGVVRMQLLGNGTSVGTDAVFIGTTEGLYRFPVADCERFSSDCCACVALRDPHCAYDPSSLECVAVRGGGGGGREGLLQNITHGDVGVCSGHQGGVATTPTPSESTDPPVVTGTGVGMSSSVEALPSPTLTPFTPSVGAITGEASGSSSQWTIIGSVFGFVGGMTIGLLVMAFCLKNKDRFLWTKLVRSRRPTVLPQTTPAASSKGASNKDVSGASNFTHKAEEYERNNCEMNLHGNAPNVVRIDPISNLPYSKHHHGNGKRDESPPPYYPSKPSVLPSNGVAVTPSGVEATPTTSHQSTPEHRRNKPSPQPRTPEKKTPIALHLAMQATPTNPPTPSQATPPNSSPLTLTPAPRNPYRRAHSHTHAPPPVGPYATLPSKKRHSSTSQSEITPTKRPSSAETPPNLSLPRPASAQNLSYAHRTRGVVATVTTPTKQRPGVAVPHSPFSAALFQGGVVPGSPFNGASSPGTPASTCSGSSHGGASHFKYPPPISCKLSEGTAAASPAYWRGEGPRGINPNVKATGYAVEATSNQERAAYGHNMATRVHTIDRRNKFQNGHVHRGQSPPVTGLHPETRVVEINGGLVGCTDC